MEPKDEGEDGSASSKGGDTPSAKHVNRSAKGQSGVKEPAGGTGGGADQSCSGGGGGCKAGDEDDDDGSLVAAQAKSGAAAPPHEQSSSEWQATFDAIPAKAVAAYAGGGGAGGVPSSGAAVPSLTALAAGAPSAAAERKTPKPGNVSSVTPDGKRDVDYWAGTDGLLKVARRGTAPLF